MENVDDVFEVINIILLGIGGIFIEDEREVFFFFGFDGLVIDWMDLKEGCLFWKFVNCYDKLIIVIIIFFIVIKDGVLFLVMCILVVDDGEVFCVELENLFVFVDLVGYSIIIENDFIYVEYYVEDMDGMEIGLVEGIGILIVQLVFSYVEGYLG